MILTIAGGSAVCMGCRGSDEQRYNRYKEIAELVKYLRTATNEQSLSSPKTPTFHKFDHAVRDGSTSKRERKEAKRQAKAADRVLVIKAKDIERIGKILHPEEPVDEEFERALLMDRSIENNMYYHPGTSNSREERDRFISEERRGKAQLKLSDAEINRIMAELGFPDLSKVKSKEERVILGRLQEKIAEDLMHDHNEARDTMQRKAGFWRWANRKAYNRLAANGRIWDWKNGEDLAPVIEHEADVDEQQAPGSAVVAAANDDVFVDKKEHADKHDDASDDRSSVASLPSEASHYRATYASSTSRDTSISSASRTTISSNDESADERWTTVGRMKAPKPSNEFKLKLSTNGGLRHLESRSTSRTPNSSTKFALLSIQDDGDGHVSGEDDAVSPRTPCPKRR